jgi:hypothetical protein
VLRPALVFTVLASASASYANPLSFVPSLTDADVPSNLQVTVDYAYSIDSAHIQREATGSGQDPMGDIGELDDLSFKQFRHIITPKLDVGLLRDTWFSFAMPIVITQARELSLDVARDASSTIRDGLLTADGFDARDPSTPLPLGGDLIFRGQNRHGLDQIYLGLGVAPMNQRRDDTKPTWKLGAELRLAVGKVMRFNATKTDDEVGVSRGVHELRLWTSFDRRFDRLEGYFEMWWLVPLTAREPSLFDDIEQPPGEFGATNTLPGQKGGITFGIETYALDDKVNNNSVSIDLGARVVGHFEGRDYSEMWEVFALAGDPRFGGPLVIDRDPATPDVQAFPHPGISNIENYLETALRFGVRGQLGKRMSFGLLFDLAWKTNHAITFADAGLDLPTCMGAGGDRPGINCETDANELVNPSTGEVNPLHVPVIDLVGHRYLSVDNFSFAINVQAQAMF